jgi:hypothetical protein
LASRSFKISRTLQDFSSVTKLCVSKIFHIHSDGSSRNSPTLMGANVAVADRGPIAVGGCR